jgi:hypothetical protein
MSSVTRFLKQINLNSYYSLPTAYTDLVVFTPDASNTTGNYTPGSFAAAVGTAPAGALLRDMGKTIISAGRSFRAVQVVVPGVTGLTAANPFGVIGSLNDPSANAKYFSLYIETGIGGGFAPVTDGVKPVGLTLDM